MFIGSEGEILVTERDSNFIPLTNACGVGLRNIRFSVGTEFHVMAADNPSRKNDSQCWKNSCASSPRVWPTS